MKTQAIIPAAGRGVRFGSKISKPLVMLSGQPLVVHALRAMEECSLIDGVVVVAQKKDFLKFKGIVRKYRLRKVKKVVSGGKERFQSVYQGLQALDEDTDFVLIHDGARPLVDMPLLKRVIKFCFKEKAVVTAVPVKPTIKEVDSRRLTVKRTLFRDDLWEIQTPQVFAKELILKAYKTKTNRLPCDDATLVEALGVKVKVLRGNYRNIKITTVDDLICAQAMMKQNSRS